MPLYWSPAIPNGYEWLQILETDIPVWFLSSLRMFCGLQGGKLVKIGNKQSKLVPNLPNQVYITLYLSLDNGYKWWQIVKTDIPVRLLSSSKVFSMENLSEDQPKMLKLVLNFQMSIKKPAASLVTSPMGSEWLYIIG